MPLTSLFAAYFVYPLSHDYFMSQTMVHGVVVSGFITACFVMFYRLLVCRFNVSRTLGLLVTCFFLMLHFLLLRVESSGNEHLFYAEDVTCYYHYIIPSLVNATLVMSLLIHDWLKPQQMSLGKGCLLTLTVYLAVFSNLYSCDILVVFLACQLLIGFPYRDKRKIVDYLKDNRMKVGMLLLFLVFAAFEAMGKRAGSFGGADNTYFVQVASALQTLVHVRLNKLFWMIFGFAVIYGAWISTKKRKVSALAVTLVLTIAVTIAYLVVLSGKVKPWYVQRADVFFAVGFPLLLLTTLTYVHLFSRHIKCAFVLPILMLVIFSRTNMDETTFKDVGAKFGYIENLQRVNASIFKQVTEAAQSQSDSVKLVVPNVHNPAEDNSPYSKKFLMYRVSWTLEKHGIISKHMDTEAILGKAVNEY